VSFLFFFSSRRRHTRSKRDWSSDVCSSDLENGIELTFTNEIERDIVCLDPDRMEQVLTNLIDNALGHTGKDGAVHVTIRSLQDKLHIEVEDNGSGIKEEDLSFIFERFYKADKSRTRIDKKGTGLGLALTKHIVKA